MTRISTISSADHLAPAQIGVTAFISLPMTLPGDRPRAFAMLHRIVVQTANVGLGSAQRFGSRYMTATYDTAEHRDQAIEALSRAKVLVNGMSYCVIAEVFGHIRHLSNDVK